MQNYASICEILHNIVHIISIYLLHLFLEFSNKNCDIIICIDCRSKMNSIKTERFNGAYGKFDEKSLFVLYRNIWLLMKI